jgi:hypothetical protein
MEAVCPQPATQVVSGRAASGKPYREASVDSGALSQVDLDALRELAWSGVPPQLRSMCWRLLLGYLPPSTERR